MVENWKAPLRSNLRYRIEERIVRPTTREQLDSDRPARHASIDLSERVIGVVRIHRDEHADSFLLARTDLEHRVVAACDILWRGEVRGRRKSVAAEDGGDVIRDADPVTRPE